MVFDGDGVRWGWCFMGDEDGCTIVLVAVRGRVCMRCSSGGDVESS